MHRPKRGANSFYKLLHLNTNTSTSAAAAAAAPAAETRFIFYTNHQVSQSFKISDCIGCWGASLGLRMSKHMAKDDSLFTISLSAFIRGGVCNKDNTVYEFQIIMQYVCVYLSIHVAR